MLISLLHYVADATPRYYAADTIFFELRHAALSIDITPRY